MFNGAIYSFMVDDLFLRCSYARTKVKFKCDSKKENKMRSNLELRKEREFIGAHHILSLCLSRQDIVSADVARKHNDRCSQSTMNSVTRNSLW